MLNQSAEACFKTVLLVCTSYRPNEHHLNVLGEHCAKHGVDLLSVFPMEGCDVGSPTLLGISPVIIDLRNALQTGYGV